jgi:peptidyl-prolyl cis-trans isomerase B (cyclophilin B)
VSSSNKRDRELARKKYERQQERRAAREAQRHRRNQIAAIVAGLVVVLGAVTAVLLSTRSSSDTTALPSSSPTTSASASATASTSASASGSAKPCAAAATPTTKTQTWAAPGGSPLPLTPPTFMKLTTNCGDIVIKMDAKNAPKTSQSMAFLAAQGFYTDSDCFRLTVTDLFVLQCGSPTNDGKGGPGYSLPDENLPAKGTNNYPAGTVAMANSGPGTSGSQFFIVYKDTTLGPDYTIWGTVVSGLDVVQNVAASGVKGGGAVAPNQTTVITKAATGTTLAG